MLTGCIAPHRFPKLPLVLVSLGFPAQRSQQILQLMQRVDLTSTCSSGPEPLSHESGSQQSGNLYLGQGSAMSNHMRWPAKRTYKVQDCA